MSLSRWLRALPRRWLVTMPMWLWLALAGGVRAQPSPVVLWLDGGDSGDSHARDRALRLELEARGILLLTAAPPAADAAAPGAPATAAPSTREALARSVLARSEADALLWLEGDPSRPVSWLRVVRRGNGAVEQAPLPHPPDAIAPDLFAVAAASLLEQVLQAAPPRPGAAEADARVQPAAAAEAGAAAAAPAQTTGVASPPPRAATPRSAASQSPRPAADDWFVQAGLSLGYAYLTSGMEAATDPSFDEIFDVMDDRHYFDDRSAWVPDGDSFDDYENTELHIPRGRTPVPGNCSADGIATGPLDLDDRNGNPFSRLVPSRYCVRVGSPGFAFVPALRVVLGRWLLPRLSLGLLYQWHFDIDPDSFFGNQLFGLLAEYLAVGTRGRGVTFSVVGGLTAGRTETPVPPKDPVRPTPNALSGPAGVQAAALLRVWPTRSFALFVSSGFSQRFPAAQFTVDLSLGAELPF